MKLYHAPRAVNPERTYNFLKAKVFSSFEDHSYNQDDQSYLMIKLVVCLNKEM